VNDSLVPQCLAIGNDVFECLGIMENIRKNEIERQIAAAFIFGSVNAFAMDKKMQPPQVNAVMLKILTDKFEYSNQQAIDFFQMLIEATQQENDPTMYYIIHCGIDGYYQYVSNATKQLVRNYRGVLERIIA
jgi:hypothetical protein